MLIITESENSDVRIINKLFIQWSMRKKVVGVCSSSNQPLAGNTDIRIANIAP